MTKPVKNIESDTISNSGYISHKLILVVGFIYVFDFFSKGYLSGLFHLQPSLVLDRMELWRLFSFPLSPGTFEATVLFFMTFLFFAPRIEKTFRKPVYISLLFILSGLQGTVLTLVFWKNDIIFSGMEGASFFILTLYLFLNIKNQIFILDIKLRAVTAVLMLIAFWFVSLIGFTMFTGQQVLFIHGMSALLFGTTCGSFTFLQIRVTKNYFQNQSEISEIKTHNPEELAPALISQKDYKMLKQNLQDEISQYQYEASYTEDKLNEILDKIIEQGEDSLTVNERKFLEDYSNQI
ncbi:MAG: rhomboid family intramembrane serine protease [Bacteroidota bacterium]|jgi:membrane associated rhomboid family serine protease